VAPEGRRRAAGIALGCLAAFALVAWQVARQGPITWIDHEVLRWFVAHRREALTQSMLWVSELHETASVLIAAGLLAAWQALRGRSALALRVLLLVPGGMLLNVGMKHVFQRARPATEEALVRLASFSFPSGHAAAATVFYAALCMVVFAHGASRGRRAAAVVGASTMTALVVASRMYLGAHYFSDVLGGVLLAGAWVALVTALPARAASARTN
jgi:undecaprenyl-diphosphatase